MRVDVGTSGYSFPEWKGAFYPRNLSASGMLSYYAERFPTVEINNTFYRLPREHVVTEWSQAVPDHFTFAIKASQRITHHARLKDAAELLEYLLRVTTALGVHRGPTLFQLPPNMKKDLERLAGFLALVPRRWTTAMEFRHASWMGDDVFDLLRAHEVALVIAESEGQETPLVATAPFGYVRLHRPAYDDAALDAWAARIQSQPWERAWVFFKHDADTAGPALASAFTRRL
jgi:uncharacterized protein YecE (DUF72 family)